MERKSTSQEDLEAKFTCKNERSHRQEIVLFDANWNKRKRQSRINNIGIAHGYITTSNGRLYVEHGIPTPRNR